jgi:phenylacetate-coenzyme A ligase PaaK-like adenylate-forming protein
MLSRNAETERLYWSHDQIAAYQLDRLRETIGRAQRSKLYAERLANCSLASLADLAALPLTAKEDLRATSPWGLVAVERDELFQYHESYGTTGTPVSGWLTQGDLRNYAAQINHSAVNFDRSDRVLVRFPYAISVPAHIVTQAAREREACVIPASSRTKISPYTRIIDLLAKLDVTVLGCLPMEAIWLAETARRAKHDPGRDFPHLRAICTAGELLSHARRQRIADLWNCRVYNLYGCTEAGNIAADCEEGRLHLSWDHFLLEILDEGLRQPVSPGERGVAVLTTLTREAMPLVRFVLGDYVRLIDDHGCPCGRQSPVIEHFGRDLNRFRREPSGVQQPNSGERWIYVRDLEQRLLTAPVEAIGDLWLIELEGQEVRFRVEASRADPRLYRRLEEEVGDELGIRLKIDAVPYGSLLNRERFDVVQPVNKPRVIGDARPDGPPLTLDDLMPG